MTVPRTIAEYIAQFEVGMPVMLICWEVPTRKDGREMARWAQPMRVQDANERGGISRYANTGTPVFAMAHVSVQSGYLARRIGGDV